MWLDKDIKYDYLLLINMSDGQPCLTNIYVDEYNSTAKYQATHQFDFTPFDDEGDFSLYRYRRHFPNALTDGKLMKLLVNNALHYPPHKS